MAETAGRGATYRGGMLVGSSSDTDLVVRAAWHYYADGLTQTQIAKRLFVSRQTVGRLVEAARQMGIVRIELDAGHLSSFQLSTRLRERFGLADAIVTPGLACDPGKVNERVAAALAAYVRRYLHPGVVVGVGWGDTVARALSMLSDESLDGVLLASAAGSIQAINESLAGNPVVASRLRVVPAPLVVSSAPVAAALRQEQPVREVLELAASAQLTITGIGSAHPETASAVRRGVVSPSEVASFVSRGAVGDMLGEWFDARGAIVASATSDRRIGLPLEQVRSMPNVVGVAGGPDKVEAIRGALEGRYIKVLVTDEPTAQALLDGMSLGRARGQRGAE